MNPDVPNFDPGGLKDRVDNRDFLYAEVGFGTSVYDWSQPYDVEVELGQVLPVKDQGASGSCGGQAWSTYIGILEAVATNSFEERSAKFVYSQVYVPGGGSRGRDCAEICVNQGVAREVVLSSYENMNPPSEMFMERSGDITSVVRQDAVSSKLLSYAQVGNKIDEIARALKNNHGIVLGIDGSNNGTWRSEFPKHPVSGEAVWHHWIYAGKIKMINGVKYIGCLNSWGLANGNKGWQWISEDYMPYVWSAWTHVYGHLPPQTFHHVFSTPLRLNDTGPEVVALQTALKIDGTFPQSVNATGLFGAITEQAVKDFQRKYAIVSSGSPSTTGYGLVGPKTRTKLNTLFQ